jgi:multidrug efflux pump
MGGMITATVFGIFFTPLFYFAARKWLSRKCPNPHPERHPERGARDGSLAHA